MVTVQGESADMIPSVWKHKGPKQYVEWMFTESSDEWAWPSQRDMILSAGPGPGQEVLIFFLLSDSKGNECLL